MTDEQIIDLISQRKEHKALVKLYKYQGKVEGLIMGRGGSKQDAIDIFQDALLIFCKKIWEGNFKLTSKIDTYLYSVCYNIWRNELAKRNQQHSFEIDEKLELAEEDNLNEILIKEAKLKSVEAILLKLGEPCLKLLKLFYYEALRMKEIATRMGYSSEKTAKAQKYKCIERAKKMI